MEYIKAETYEDEKFDWLQVVKQYCNRYPNLELKTFGLNFGYYNTNQLGELKFDYFQSCLEIDNCTSPIRHVYLFERENPSPKGKGMRAINLDFQYIV